MQINVRSTTRRAVRPIHTTRLERSFRLSRTSDCGAFYCCCSSRFRHVWQLFIEPYCRAPPQSALRPPNTQAPNRRLAHSPCYLAHPGISIPRNSPATTACLNRSIAKSVPPDASSPRQNSAANITIVIASTLLHPPASDPGPIVSMAVQAALPSATALPPRSSILARSAASKMLR